MVSTSQKGSYFNTSPLLADFITYRYEELFSSRSIEGSVYRENVVAH